MSEAKFTAGRGPSRRLNFVEFLSEKVRRIEESHKKCRLQYIDLQKELELVRNNELKYEGFLHYMKSFLNEWSTYSNDTAKLRQAEERSRLERSKEHKKKDEDKWAELL